MMAKKSRVNIEIDCMGSVEVLGPIEFEGTGDTRGAEESGDAGSGTVTDGVVETGIWGSSAGTVGGY